MIYAYIWLKTNTFLSNIFEKKGLSIKKNVDFYYTNDLYHKNQLKFIFFLKNENVTSQRISFIVNKVKPALRGHFWYKEKVAL
jgi:hypothetical protein